MSDDQLHSDREIIFGELLAAFGRHDHEVIRAAMRPDVVLVMPGSSPLAGTYRGIDEVGRFVISLRVALDSGRHEVDFEHDGDEMVVRHKVEVHGPRHVAGMILYQRFTFDSASGKITSITVEPEDRGLFDYVIHSRLGDTRDRRSVSAPARSHSERQAGGIVDGNESRSPGPSAHVP